MWTCPGGHSPGRVTSPKLIILWVRQVYLYQRKGRPPWFFRPVPGLRRPSVSPVPSAGALGYYLTPFGLGRSVPAPREGPASIGSLRASCAIRPSGVGFPRRSKDRKSVV